jgi:hypothetical protein
MKLSLLIVLSFFIVHRGLGQKISFTDTSNLWIVDYHEFDPGIDKKYDGYFKFMDTTQVAGNQYLILKKYYYNSFYITTAYIREDTAGKKVYARNISATDTSEHLLYDYTLAVGDTFLMYHPSDTFRHVVSAVDTLFINTIAHRRWWFTHITPNTINYEVIEGVGCMRDPLTPYFPRQLFGIGWHLKCFRNAHTGLSAGNPSWYTTNCLLDVDDPVSLQHGFNVYPNPARREVNFTWRVASNKSTIIAVYDMTGRLIVRLVSAIGQKALTVNTSAWTNSIYLVKAYLEDGSFSTAKLVIGN